MRICNRRLGLCKERPSTYSDLCSFLECFGELNSWEHCLEILFVLTRATIFSHGTENLTVALGLGLGN